MVRLSRKNYQFIEQKKIPESQYNHQLKVCEINTTDYLLAIWYSDCYLMILDCSSNNKNCTTEILNEDNCVILKDNSYLPTKKADFTANCQYFIHYHNNKYLRILKNIKDNLTFYYKSISIINSNGIFFLDNSIFNYAQMNSSFIVPFRTDNISITTNNKLLLG